MKESKQSACGCLIERDGWDGFSILTLTYCPKHLAASAMYEALLGIDRWFEQQNKPTPEYIIKALAQAEGKMP